MNEINDIWNQVTDTWNITPLFWSFTPEFYGGKAPEDYFSWLNDSKSLQVENNIKIFITIHNQFLTEEQKKFFKRANVYPSYKEQFEIKKQEKIFLTEYKIKKEINLKANINIDYVKLGFKKIEENAKNRNK